jgi:magnesium-transporting ATPase (P-type)
MTIATDNVDPEVLSQPRRWNVSMIRKFMLVFGILSSFFDYLTFAVLLWLLRSSPELFRTGWFVESVLSASWIVLVIRTRKRLFQSRPGNYLVIATLAIGAITVSLPYVPFVGKLLGFQKLPLFYFAPLGLILILYTIAAEIAKHIFYKRISSERSGNSMLPSFYQASADCICQGETQDYSAIIFSIRRSGINQIAATKTYNPKAIHEFTNDNGMAMA